MARIVSVHSFRGGTGKSNTTANLATLGVTSLLLTIAAWALTCAIVLAVT
jgi:septum formation inhibitor-activating ATPase MinD